MSVPARPWQATDKPNDACCWEAHIETVARDVAPAQATDPRPWTDVAAEGVADVWDWETADFIVQRVNAFDALLAVANAAAETGVMAKPLLFAALANLDRLHPEWRTWA